VLLSGKSIKGVSVGAEVEDKSVRHKHFVKAAVTAVVLGSLVGIVIWQLGPSVSEKTYEIVGARKKFLRLHRDLAGKRAGKDIALIASSQFGLQMNWRKRWHLFQANTFELSNIIGFGAMLLFNTEKETARFSETLQFPSKPNWDQVKKLNFLSDYIIFENKNTIVNSWDYDLEVPKKNDHLKYFWGTGKGSSFAQTIWKCDESWPKGEYVLEVGLEGVSVDTFRFRIN